MIRQIAYASMLILVAGAAHAQTGRTSARTLSAKRQVSDCMAKRMSASRALSYNAAIALCKAEVKSQNAAFAASLSSKPVS